MPPTETPPPLHRTDTRLVHSHPIAIAITAVVCLFVLVGLALVPRVSPQEPGSIQVWGSDAIPLQNPTSFQPSYRTPPALAIDTSTSTGALHFFYTTPAKTTSVTPPQEDADFNAFFNNMLNAASPIKPVAHTTVLADDPQIQRAYLAIPQGLLSTSTPKTRTPSQEALYRYGNGAGAIIKAFDSGHPDEQLVLTAQAKDRGSLQKAQALRDLAKDIGSIGTQLLALSNVPESARAANTDLGTRYQKVGELLALVADAGDDDARALAAITAYNAVADAFTRSFVGLATLFALNNVSFSSTDGGSAFTFSNASGF